MKYVIFENDKGENHVILHSNKISHKSIGGKHPSLSMELCDYNYDLQIGKPVSAGFFKLQSVFLNDGPPKVYGRSESLSMEMGYEIESREEDLQIIIDFLNTDDY